jgi:hypothetical protein
MTLKTLMDGGINWNWYLQAEFNEVEQTCHIYFNERWHKFDNPKHPKVTDYNANLSLMHDTNKVVYGVRMFNKEYLVTNPKPEHEYQDFSKLVLE